MLKSEKYDGNYKKKDYTFYQMSNKKDKIKVIRKKANGKRRNKV